MPDFTQWNVPSPFPNILYNPAAVDAAIARTQSELGNLDINQQELQLKKDEFARGQSFADTWNKSIDGTTGTTGAGVGGTYAPGTPFTPKMLPPGVSLDEDAMVRTIAGEAGSEPLTGQIAVAHVINNRAKGAGVSPRDVVFSPNQFEPWNGGAARARLEAMQPTDPQYQAILNNVVRPAMTGKAADPTGGATHFYAPVAQQALGRPPPSWGSGTPSAVIGGHRFYSLGYGPGQARVAAAPDATPTVAPQAAPGIIPPTAPGVNPNAKVNFPPTTPIVAAPAANPNAGPRVGTAPTAPTVAPATTPAADPNARVEADDPNMAAVKQASTALLAMPEPDAAAAYPAVVRELQARGLAMNAPSEYPGHAALQAIVGGGQADEAVPVAPSRIALRTGGIDTAGPAAGQTTLPPVEQPNRMYQTGLAGVTIAAPGNALAPPPVVTAAAPAAPAAAPPGATRPPLEAPPAAPTRVIPREPLIQSGPAAGLTRTQAVTIGQMLSSGAKPAVVMQHADEMRHQNDVIRQGDATQAAIEQQANYERRQKAEQTAYDRAEKAKADAIAAAAEKRAADKAAAEAADPLQGKSEDERIERTLLQLAPKVRAGQPLSDAEKDQYTLLWNKYREGPIQQVPDGKGGTFTARVPREVPAEFPPPPGQRVAAGPQAIPGTEKPPEMAPPAITGGMLANGVGQRKVMAALTGLLAHPDAVGLKANVPDWLLQRTDPEGVRLRGDISDVAGHEFHDLSGAAVSASEASRLKFIPSEKDTAEALKTKLSRMLELNRETMLQSYRTYGPENGGRRLPAVEDAIVDSIPEAAIDMLKTKPETARDFDKKYGKGAAKLVLQYGG